VVAKKDGIVVWHHGWRLLVSGAGAQSVLSLVCLCSRAAVCKVDWSPVYSMGIIFI
jgi:hypothetical protein